jgi:hypothetical protein
MNILLLIGHAVIEKFRSIKENKTASVLPPENSLSGAIMGDIMGKDVIYDTIPGNNIGILKDERNIILTQINNRTTTSAYRP